MQSQQSSKQQKRIPLSLPWGFGSMAWKGASWQLVWRDPEGKVHWEGSGTDDAAEAQKILANRALPRAKAMVAQLEAIAHGEIYQGDAKAGAGARRPKAGGRAKGTRRNRPQAQKGETR